MMFWSLGETENSVCTGFAQHSWLSLFCSLAWFACRLCRNLSSKRTSLLFRHFLGNLQPAEREQNAAAEITRLLNLVPKNPSEKPFTHYKTPPSKQPSAKPPTLRTLLRVACAVVQPLHRIERGNEFLREIGAMWQIGVLTGKPCTFWSKMGDSRRFGNIPSLRKILPTDNLLFSNEFPKSYRYRYRSAILLELLKLPLPMPITLPLQCPLFASLSLSAVKRCLLVTCSRPQRPPSCTQTCWAVYGKKERLHMAEGPASNYACFFKKNEKLPLCYLDSRSLNPAENPCSPQSASLTVVSPVFPLVLLPFPLYLHVQKVRQWKGTGVPFPRPSTGPRSPSSRKLLWRLLEKLAGKLGALGGVPAELLRRLSLFLAEGFLRIFYFWAAGFFRGFCRRIVSLTEGQKGTPVTGRDKKCQDRASLSRPLVLSWPLTSLTSSPFFCTSEDINRRGGGSDKMQLEGKGTDLSWHFLTFLFPSPFWRPLLPFTDSHFFVGESAQKNPPGKSPTKSAKIKTTKIPNTFLQNAPKRQEQSPQQFPWHSPQHSVAGSFPSLCAQQFSGIRAPGPCRWSGECYFNSKGGRGKIYWEGKRPLSLQVQ